MPPGVGAFHCQSMDVHSVVIGARPERGVGPLQAHCRRQHPTVVRHIEDAPIDQLDHELPRKALRPLRDARHGPNPVASLSKQIEHGFDIVGLRQANHQVTHSHTALGIRYTDGEET